MHFLLAPLPLFFCYCQRVVCCGKNAAQRGKCCNLPDRLRYLSRSLFLFIIDFSRLPQCLARSMHSLVMKILAPAQARNVEKEQSKKKHMPRCGLIYNSPSTFFLPFVAEEKLANLSVLACTGGFVACFLFLSSLKFSLKRR